MQTCKDCKFANALQDDQFSCQRFPPQSHLLQQKNQMTGEVQIGMQSAFPVVQGDYWCGEWKRQDVDMTGYPAGFTQA